MNRQVTELLYLLVVAPLFLVLTFTPFWLPVAFLIWHWARRRNPSRTGIAVFLVVEVISAAIFLFVCWLGNFDNQ